MPPIATVIVSPSPNDLSAPFLLNFPISPLYKIGTPVEKMLPKNAAREYIGVTRFIPSTAALPSVAPAIRVSEIISMVTTIIVTVPLMSSPLNLRFINVCFDFIKALPEYSLSVCRCRLCLCIRLMYNLCSRLLFRAPQSYKCYSHA